MAASDGDGDALRRVTLYRAPTTEADADALADWLRTRLAAAAGSDAYPEAPAVEVRGRLLDRLVGNGDASDGEGVDPEALAEAFAEARVLSPGDPETGNTMLGIVRYEERALAAPERAGGVVYDGLAVQRALNRRLAEAGGDADLGHAHVALLDRVLGTWGDHDGRWHKRVAVLGQPGLVSVPGLYEAPAKPEAYYKQKGKYALASGSAPPREVLEEQVDGEFLVADDPRTTEALKGYVLAAVHLLATGEDWCDDERCRLANPHRQPGVVRAQLRDPEFCPEHAALYGSD